MQSALQELEAMIAEFDPMAEEYWLERKDLFLGQGIDEEMTRMENHLRNYNFERASEFVGRIRQHLEEEEA